MGRPHCYAQNDKVLATTPSQTESTGGLASSDGLNSNSTPE